MSFLQYVFVYSMVLKHFFFRLQFSLQHVFDCSISLSTACLYLQQFFLNSDFLFYTLHFSFTGFLFFCSCSLLTVGFESVFTGAFNLQYCESVCFTDNMNKPVYRRSNFTVFRISVLLFHSIVNQFALLTVWTPLISCNILSWLNSLVPLWCAFN